MSLVLTKGYTWKEGELPTARKYNIVDTIADGQAGVFSSVTSSAYATGTATGITTTITSASLVGKTITVTNGIITGFA